MRCISKPKPAPNTITAIVMPAIAWSSHACWGSWLGVGDVEGDSIGDGVGVRVGVGAFGSGTAWGFGAVKMDYN